MIERKCSTCGSPGPFSNRGTVCKQCAINRTLAWRAKQRAQRATKVRRGPKVANRRSNWHLKFSGELAAFIRSQPVAYQDFIENLVRNDFLASQKNC